MTTDTQTKPKYDIHVQLSGENGNAFMILALCMRAARRSGLMTEQEINQFRDEAMSKDYNHLLVTAMRYFNVS